MVFCPLITMGLTTATISASKMWLRTLRIGDWQTEQGNVEGFYFVPDMFKKNLVTVIQNIRSELCHFNTHTHFYSHINVDTGTSVCLEHICCMNWIYFHTCLSTLMSDWKWMDDIQQQECDCQTVWFILHTYSVRFVSKYAAYADFLISFWDQ